MNEKKYPIVVEVAGTHGMFGRPDCGSESFSYPMPTSSACRGMIESIVRIPSADLEIVAVGSCSFPQWSNYSFFGF